MKKYQLVIFATMWSAFLYCFNAMSQESNSSPKKEAKADRDMFGMQAKRGLILNSEVAVPGYIMFSVTNSASTYLINRKGEVVHEWKGNYGALSPYLNDDGSLTLNAEDPDFPVFAGGGQAGRIQKINWDSKMLWDFEYSNEDYCNHHDIAILPNGNVLTISWEAKTREEALAAGLKPELIPKDGIWPEKIVEIEPIGKRHGKVVWEWHLWDHLVQNHDSSKMNFASPAEHPELLDINLLHPLPEAISQDSMDILHANHAVWRNQTLDNRGSDAFHFNAINYNAELDQIAFSSQVLSEIYIIDHSTSTEEAAGHTGGLKGKGGDFLYRWGNPVNYQRGDSSHRQLFHQHDVQWIEKGMPGAGNLIVFNNDVSGRADSMNYSTVVEFTPPMDSKGQYILQEGKHFGPEKPLWTYVAADTISFWSSFISGAHRMKNGNTFINEGAKGRFFEVTPEGEIVWEYLTPYRGEIRFTNGDIVPPIPMTHIQFRSTFIPESHPGLANRKLEPLDPQPKVFKLDPPNDSKGQ